MVNKSTASSAIESERAQQLQFLRFLAFLNVFISHTEEWNFLRYPASHAGPFAVSFFFMLSGLVTGWSAFGKETALTLRSIGAAWWKRARKIYPVYILTVLLAVLSSRLPELVASRDWAELGNFGKQLGSYFLLLQTWPPFEFAKVKYSFNGSSWFLCCLAFLWLFNVPGTWLLQKIEKLRARYVIMGAAFAALMVGTVCYCRLTQNLLMSYWHSAFPPARIGEYLGGMILGFSIRSFLSRWDRRRELRLLFTLLEIAALAFWCFSLKRAGNYWMNYIVAWLIPNTFLLTVFTFGGGYISSLLRAKPLVRLGDISFECYMVHHLIVIRYFSLHPMDSWSLPDQILAFTFCLLLTVFSACLLHQASVK